MSAPVPGSGIYLVANSTSTAGRPLATIVAEAVAAGVGTIQLRCKDLSAREFLAEAAACAEHTAGRALLLLNDRVDVYLAARAAGIRVDGVHIGQKDLPAELVRSLIGPDAVLGLSASTEDHFAAVAELPAGTIDYLGTGAVRATPTKKDHPTPLGFPGLASLISRAPLPCVAIGGLGSGDAADAHTAGAIGMAVVRAICSAAEPRDSAAALVQEWTRAARTETA
ncbi:MAG: thiamine phosphate synthase [Arthrobacter sp.]|uniref:thiamine phosphate synthase n=1 Tax=Arthrobacter sp. 179 TaxID=3457734 RepID=UPI00264DBAEE|nr:thiamine phosphate synthase [Micrococcaceae bacterium]MDN5879609.1 thiamine phosphate synthase [Micrococcaceae bacterium]MDN5885694.1 thiamine phosphate synthase [Micrococcaceae bacterium]MDN6168721.1 thiamine phosphate synthase [Micrococcaceae bacterium]MDN6202342.1 thiamine phosphate synthase [Micrococcaceae bacterium]